MTLLELSFLALLLAVSLYDLRHYAIPDSLVLCLFGVGVAKVFLERSVLSPLLGASFLFGLFLFLHLLFPQGMGFGDVKLAGSIGLFLGFRLSVVAFLLAFFSGSIVGLFLVLLRKKTLKDPLPFGPFLSFGAIVSLFFGEEIIAWYLNLWAW
ncbi:MAG: prepilin peptidase [Candidatus Caldatribacterium sp.]|nr:prepilin peptidase [Candidatus Caldatribacterium sp.]